MPAIRVGSQTVYYDNCGAGHPELLIPGMGISRFVWWKQLDTLSRSYRLIDMDNRDAGDSSPGAGPYGIPDMAEDAAGLIRALKLGPMHVVGWSMGGFIALELALRYPDLVGKVVLTSTSAGGWDHVPPSWELSMMFFPHETENFQEHIERIYSAIAAPGYMQSHVEDLNKVLRLTRSKPMSIESYRRQVGAVMAWSGVGEHLNQIRQPTLVIHGSSDPLVPYANGRFLSENIRGARLLPYVNVGHLPPIEASWQFNRDVAEFLG